MSTNQPGKVSAESSGVPGEGVPDARQHRTILIAVCVALMAVIASVSGLNVAQPDLAITFGASQSTILWILNIYTLSLAALLLPRGAIGDRLGRKPMLMSGLTILGVASAAAGFAPSATVMLAARLFSGVGAAIIGPADAAREGVANAVAAAHQAGPHAQVLIRAAQESFVDGWQHAMWAGVAVMAALVFYVLARGPQHPIRTPANEPEPADATAG